MKKKVIIVSGYFNPLHKGHIEYFHQAKKHGDFLFVIINNDFQRKLKNSLEFILEKERMLLVKELRVVDQVFLSIDKDRSVSLTIEKIVNSDVNDFEFYFANGGDQNNNKIPESSTCEELGVFLIDGLGEKIQSSSWLIKKTK